MALLGHSLLAVGGAHIGAFGCLTLSSALVVALTHHQQLQCKRIAGHLSRHATRVTRESDRLVIEYDQLSIRHLFQTTVKPSEKFLRLLTREAAILDARSDADIASLGSLIGRKELYLDLVYGAHSSRSGLAQLCALYVKPGDRSTRVDNLPHQDVPPRIAVENIARESAMFSVLFTQSAVLIFGATMYFISSTHGQVSKHGRQDEGIEAVE